MIAALREYYADADDATDDPLVRVLPNGLPVADLDRLSRLLLRALREQQAEINALEARVVALETRLLAK